MQSQSSPLGTPVWLLLGWLAITVGYFVVGFWIRTEPEELLLVFGLTQSGIVAGVWLVAEGRSRRHPGLMAAGALGVAILLVWALLAFPMSKAACLDWIQVPTSRIPGS